MRKLIKNGTIVTAEETRKGDILIDGEVIIEIGSDIVDETAVVIDATDCYVMPGAIDVHTHMELDVGIAVSTDDFYTGTVAAACGGTTTIIDHIGFGPKGCHLEHQIGVYHEKARDKAVIDYGFHGVVQHVNDEILDEFGEIVQKEGINSFKIYLTYDFKLDDLEAYQVLKRLGELDVLTAVHPENHQIIDYFRKKFIGEGKTGPAYHAKSRPLECEAEAISRMINLAAIAGDAPLYIVHLSNGLGLDYIRMAQGNGQQVYAETCPQYLLLDEGCYDAPAYDGLKYVMSPPIREKSNQQRLWDGLNDGSISVMATDHCPFDLSTKIMKGKDDFTKCPNGAAGVETRVPLIFSEGVMTGKLDINRFVDVMSTTPAKLFGIYPQKGCIAIGSDADIILIDPRKEVTISNEMLHQNVDYTPFEGFSVQGYPVMTISRGEIIVKDNQFIGKKGRGQYLKRGSIIR